MTGEIQIYTDGSCYPNPGPGGWAAVLVCGEMRKEISGQGEYPTTNGRMELMAAIMALETVRGRNRHISLTTDAQYLITASQMRIRHKTKNVDLVKRLQEVIRELARRGNTVSFLWIKGHTGHAENERCDKLAGERRLEFMP